jgi:hypothetical protein
MKWPAETGKVKTLPVANGTSYYATVRSGVPGNAGSLKDAGLRFPAISLPAVEIFVSLFGQGGRTKKMFTNKLR